MAVIKESWLQQVKDILNEYEKMPDVEWQKLKSMISVLKLKKGEHLIQETDIPDKLGFIISGIFRVYYTTESGDEKIIVFREENRLLAAYSSFLENMKSQFSIQALEDSILLYVSFSDYNNLLNGHSYWQTVAGKYAQKLFIEKEKREGEFLSDDAETRYKKFINVYPTFEERINQYHIASYLGITHITLSRIKNKLNKEK